MTGSYMLGLILAILSGAMNAWARSYKKPVNRILSKTSQGSFTAQFTRDPVWLAGLAVTMGWALSLTWQPRSASAQRWCRFVGVRHDHPGHGFDQNTQRVLKTNRMDRDYKPGLRITLLDFRNLTFPRMRWIYWIPLHNTGLRYFRSY